MATGRDTASPRDARPRSRRRRGRVRGDRTAQRPRQHPGDPTARPKDGAGVTFPAHIGVVDLMIGFPSANARRHYDFMKPMLRDAGSGRMEFPAEYMFKQVPNQLAEDADPVEVTLAEMDRHGVAIGLVGLGGEAAARALQRYPDRFKASLEVDPNDITGA